MDQVVAQTSRRSRAQATFAETTEIRFETQVSASAVAFAAAVRERDSVACGWRGRFGRAENRVGDVMGNFLSTHAF